MTPRVNPDRATHTRKGKKRPAVVGETAKALVTGLIHRRGTLYGRLAGAATVVGYSKAERRRRDGRYRRWRSDGVESAVAMLLQLLSCADVRTGDIAIATAGGKIRLSVAEQAGRAGLTERTGERMVAFWQAEGVLRTVFQRREQAEDGSYQSLPAVMRLDWSRLTKLVGTYWLLRQELRRLGADSKPVQPATMVQATQPAGPRTLDEIAADLDAAALAALVPGKPVPAAVVRARAEMAAHAKLIAEEAERRKRAQRSPVAEDAAARLAAFVAALRTPD